MREKEGARLSGDQDLYPKKMIVRHGAKHVLLDTKDVVYCYSNNKVVFIVAADQQKYIADKNLIHLESDLDPNVFFKANRTHIINFNYIRSFITHERNKIKVELRSPQNDCEEVVVSQTRVNLFRQWIYQQL